MSRQRDYKAEYRRRQQRARSRGFSGYAQQRKFSPKILSAKGLGRLPESARAARSDALRVVRKARTGRVPVERVARENQLPVDVVRWWAGDALEPTHSGRTFARPGDRLLRLQPIFLADDDGVRFVEIRGSNAASRAQHIFDVQYRFIEGEASVEELEGIAGQRVAGRVVESDPDRLEAIADAHGVDIPEAYREILG
ncbi:MAG: hypothetical protein ABSH36_12190 [Solirubrobacteraceae bacterium]